MNKSNQSTPTKFSAPTQTSIGNGASPTPPANAAVSTAATSSTSPPNVKPPTGKKPAPTPHDATLFLASALNHLQAALGHPIDPTIIITTHLTRTPDNIWILIQPTPK